MKLFPLILVAAIATPQVASAHTRLKSGEFEVEPSHCAFDKTFESWNCWYRPAPRPLSLIHI